MRIHKNDTVVITKGVDAGKRGKVLEVLHEDESVIVEGARKLWKHVRRSEKHPKGGRIQVEGPVGIANVKIICGACTKPTKIKYEYRSAKTAKENPNKGPKQVKIRVCKKCKKPVGGE